MNTPTDKPNTPAESSANSAEHSGANDMAPHSTRSTRESDAPVDLTPVFSDMGESEQEHRRMALRSMLAATEARQQHGKRSRNQTLAAGLRVGVRGGEHAGAYGIILDADYIHSRVLIDLGDGSPAVWVNFNLVSALSTDTGTRSGSENDPA